ncbi:hypothetical protein QQP08_026593 [Theobroma cacao]|nr:hypothetical protein QQP08_026593 [Theobroma cacao]
MAVMFGNGILSLVDVTTIKPMLSQEVLGKSVVKGKRTISKWGRYVPTFSAVPLIFRFIQSLFPGKYSEISLIHAFTFYVYCLSIVT